VQLAQDKAEDAGGLAARQGRERSPAPVATPNFCQVFWRMAISPAAGTCPDFPGKSAMRLPSLSFILRPGVVWWYSSECFTSSVGIP